MATGRSEELRALAQRVADALPPTVVEVVVTGSVSRGVADEASDVEMLLVTTTRLDLGACLALARDAGLRELDTWAGAPPPAQRVSGYLVGSPIELIVWPREHAEAQIESLLRDELPSQTTGDALVHGVALRTSGLLAAWQERLADYPEELASARIEKAAARWGGFSAASVLTIARPGDRLALEEWLVDSASRILAIVHALNRVWQPTTKRLADRTAALALSPERLAERIGEALLEPDAHRALLRMAEMQAEAVRLAPDGPMVERARRWLAEVVEILR